MGEWVLITGSSKGLGKELALVFAEKGYNVIIHGRNEFDLLNLKNKIISMNVECEVVIGDLLLDETIEKLYNISRENNLSVLINNAGVGLLKSFNEFDIREIENAINVNLIAPIKLTKKIYNLFSEKREGKIININSMDGLKITKDSRTAYSSGKFGLKGFSDALRYESKKLNIDVIGVYLGGINTSMYSNNNQGVGGIDPKEVAQTILESISKKNSLNIDEIHINRKSF
jgi:short-subunit dehydrogenase